MKPDHLAINLLWFVGALWLAVLPLVLAAICQRVSEVLKTPRLYRLFYVTTFGVLCYAFGHIISTYLVEMYAEFTLSFILAVYMVLGVSQIALAVGLTCALVAVAFYGYKVFDEPSERDR